MHHGRIAHFSFRLILFVACSPQLLQITANKVCTSRALKLPSTLQALLCTAVPVPLYGGETCTLLLKQVAAVLCSVLTVLNMFLGR